MPPSLDYWIMGSWCRSSTVTLVAKWEGRRVAVPNRHEPNSFPEIQPTPSVLHFLSVLIRGYPWLKKPGDFEGI